MVVNIECSSMVVNIETKHDALTNFFLITIIIWIGISEMKCLSHTNLIPELQIFMIVIPTPIPLGRIPILIPIPDFTKIHDSDTDSKSSVSQTTWFRFWFRFQHHVIQIQILIPANH